MPIRWFILCNCISAYTLQVLVIRVGWKYYKIFATTKTTKALCSFVVAHLCIKLVPYTQPIYVDRRVS